MKKTKTGIFWFTNDMRLHDNPALMRANTLMDSLLCIYVIDFTWMASSQYSLANKSKASLAFLSESLSDLQHKLEAIGQQLLVIEATTVPALIDLIEENGASDVFRSDHAGWYENRAWEILKKKNPVVSFHSVDSHTLFDLELMPFSLEDLPTSFTKFKNAVKDLKPLKPIEALTNLPPPPNGCCYASKLDDQPIGNKFRGGETHGLAVLTVYFTTEKPMFYKEVRNAIDGWDNSTKLSPWLANGCLSVREVMATLLNYESTITANESTYWIYFELLWREYFQWYAHRNGVKLFSFGGIKSDIKNSIKSGTKKSRPLNSFYPERFQKWVNGATPYPIVNACMNELRETGFLSNRGRQIVASCFVNELAMDWRYGAAYFEQVLIDYDVASNWGNWQYLAGVGADVREKRHFNLDKQTQQFDADGRYIKLWDADEKFGPLDSVDASDWPIS